MKRAVLADTGPLYAAVDPDDSLHKRAAKELDRLSQEKREVVVTYPTLLEAYTLVLFRLGKGIASGWMDDMTNATLLNPSLEDYRQGAIKVRAFPDQSITLFDATIAAVSMRLDLPVWTYDHHFDLMRMKIWR